MSTGSLSDGDDAQEAVLSPSEDDCSNDGGFHSKPGACSGKANRPSQRHAANARERARMKVLAKAFSRLKTSLPWVPADTKLSKLDTLRLASSYITHLRELLHQDTYERNTSHPRNLSWPFVLTGREDENKDPSPFRLCGASA